MSRISDTHPATLGHLRDTNGDYEVTKGLIRASNRLVESAPNVLNLAMRYSSALDYYGVLLKDDADSILFIKGFKGCVYFTVTDQHGGSREIELSKRGLTMQGKSWSQDLEEGVEYGNTELTIFAKKAFRLAKVIQRLFSESNFEKSENKTGGVEASLSAEPTNDTEFKVIFANRNWNVRNAPMNPFTVKGHARLQKCGKGRTEVRAVSVKAHIKKGITSNKGIV